MPAVALDIIVVGGGIAGLGAAITLSRGGHNVTVLEKSRFKREAGFMITLGANATRVLKSFDFDFARARAVDVNYIETYDGKTLERLEKHGIHEFEVEDGLKTRTFYRPDLHSELKRIALLRSPDFRSPVLRLGCEVVNIDILAGTVELKDGAVLKADLVVGADGERSLVREAFQDGIPLRQAPYKMFRAIVPREVLEVDERDRKMMDLTNGKFVLFQNGTRTLSWFEGRDGLLQDIEGGYLLGEGDDATADPDPEKAYNRMLETFGDYHPDIVNAIRKAERVSEWEVWFAMPLPHLYKHKAVLVGDAAHSMFPTTGQGGSQSFEDVSALAILLSNLGSKSETPERLKIFEGLRKKRTGIVQALSGIVFGGEEKLARKRPRHPINQIGIKSAEQHMKFLFEYNIITEAERALDVGTRDRAQL